MPHCQTYSIVPQDVSGWVCLLQKGIKSWDEQAAVAYEHRWEFRCAPILAGSPRPHPSLAGPMGLLLPLLALPESLAPL